MNRLSRTALCAVILTLLLVAVAEAKTPIIQAYRGGSYVNGKPAFPENTMPAFANAAKDKSVLELEVKLTKDGVPVVIHDDTLERTTNCTGAVKDKTLAQIGRCRADVLGSPGRRAGLFGVYPGTGSVGPYGGLKIKTVSRPTVKVPTLEEVLAFVKKQKATVIVEIKNWPGDNDYDPTFTAYTNKVMGVVVASRVPKSKLIIESLIPPNLDAARKKLPGVALSLLTPRELVEAYLTFATANRYTWLSNYSWDFFALRPVVTASHGAGKLVAYFAQDATTARVLAGVGVDALLTDDPAMVRKALGLKG